MTGLALAATLVIFPLLLSGCVTDSYFDKINPFSSPPPIPPVSVAAVTTPPAQPDTPALYCKIGRGSALFGRDWYDFSDALFVLHRGDPANVAITRVHSTEQMTIQVLYDGSGQKLIFCPFLNVGPGRNGPNTNSGASAPDQRISCSSLYALEDDLNDGIKRTFDIPSAVRGGAITCAYIQEHLRPLTPGGN